MDSLPCSLADVMAALARGVTVLTGNQRAARTLRGLYRSSQQQSGQLTVQSANLHAWDGWTASLWQKLLQSGAEERLLLNPLQERMLWQEIIAKEDSLATLRSAESLASIASSAWARLNQYGGRDRLKSMASTADTQAFVGWADAFERRCRAGDLLSAAQLEKELNNTIRQGRLKLNSDLLLVGFGMLTPAQENLLESLNETGTSIQFAHLQHSESQQAGSNDQVLLAAASEQEELRAAALWARDILRQSITASVAVLVPNLGDERNEIERVLRDVLAPELHDITATSPAPYEFSLGASLASYSMTAAALDLIRWTIGPMPIQSISALLLSPYFGPQGRTERGLRAEFDAFKLRQTKLLQPELSLQSMQKVMQANPKMASIARLLAAMAQLANDRGLASSRRLGFGEWMEHVRELLRVAGWPGTRTLDSTEFQLRRKWESVLDQVATLDFAGRSVSFAESVDQLEKALLETTFAPQSHGAPVQVMGILEAAGSLFDAVWVLRGADGVWPQTSGPHPLLPWQLQRLYNMPGADVFRSQEESRATIQRIRFSSLRVVFSYAREGKEGPQRRSAVVEELGWAERDAASLEPSMPLTQTEVVTDDEQLPTLPDQVLRGGESILRLQAACGFRAFAERRLFSTTPDTVSLGLDAREWGILLHDAIRRFWAEVKTQSALQAMSLAERDSLLSRSIEAALHEAPAASTIWEAAYVQIQRQRLHSLIAAWLPLELNRKPFEVRVSEKAFTDIAVGPLRLDLRADRIDQVDDGEVLIDYKTGLAAAGKWAGLRPDEPQLPLYAAFAGEQPLQAIAFAKLRAGREMRLDGFDAGNEALPLKQIDMEAQLAEWREVLLRLAQDFAEGHADVNPKDYPTTCKYCSQRLLCRLDASLLNQDEADKEETVG